MSIALFLQGDPTTEALGVRLLNEVGAMLREIVGEVPDIWPAPHGPGFDYASSWALFHSRRGCGPLHIACDTNLLIDYFQEGRALWSDSDWSEAAQSYVEEIEALQIVMALWVIRDIRFHIPERVLNDAKRRLTGRRLQHRVHAFEQFAAALRLVGYGEEDFCCGDREGLLVLPDESLEDALAAIPGAADRDLVREAVNMGVSVFLTRDARVLRAAPHFGPFGLRIASPGDVLEALMSCGAFHCLLAPEYAFWPLPDQARVTHLVSALGLDKRERDAMGLTQDQSAEIPARLGPILSAIEATHKITVAR